MVAAAMSHDTYSTRRTIGIVQIRSLTDWIWLIKTALSQARSKLVWFVP